MQYMYVSTLCMLELEDRKRCGRRLLHIGRDALQQRHHRLTDVGRH